MRKVEERLGPNIVKSIKKEKKMKKKTKGKGKRIKETKRKNKKKFNCLKNIQDTV